MLTATALGLLMQVAASADVPAAPVEAAPTAAQLLQECQTDNNGCYGYLLGIYDAINVILPSVSDQKLICPTGRVSGGQLSAIYQKWAGDNPSSMGLYRRDAAAVAFAQAFPCPPDSPEQSGNKGP